MPNLTALEKTRTALVVITLAAPLATSGVALKKWMDWRDSNLDFPLQNALLNIAAAYMPILIIVFGFLWTLEKRPKPPKGDRAMDNLANLVAVFVFAVTLGIPIAIYALTEYADDASQSMVLYSSLMHTLLTAAMVYYFGKPLVEQRKSGRASSPRAPAAK